MLTGFSGCAVRRVWQVVFIKATALTLGVPGYLSTTFFSLPGELGSSQLSVQGVLSTEQDSLQEVLSQLNEQTCFLNS